MQETQVRSETRVQSMWETRVLPETRVQSLGWEEPLGKEMATHSSTLAWKIPWMEEPGRLHSMGSQRVGHDWVSSLSFFPFPTISFETGVFTIPIYRLANWGPETQVTCLSAHSLISTWFETWTQAIWLQRLSWPCYYDPNLPKKQTLGLLLTTVFLMPSTVPESKAALSKYSVRVYRKKDKGGGGGSHKTGFHSFASSFP